LLGDGAFWLAETFEKPREKEEHTNSAVAMLQDLRGLIFGNSKPARQFLVAKFGSSEPGFFAKIVQTAMSEPPSAKDRGQI
jgi:hypothetical protein